MAVERWAGLCIHQPSLLLVDVPKLMVRPGNGQRWRRMVGAGVIYGCMALVG